MVIETWKEAAILPAHLRIDIQRASGNFTAIYSGDSLFVVRGDSTASRLALRNVLLIMGFDVYGQPAEQTLAVLHGQHYATTSVREDTWEGPVYVIGAPPGDTRTAQIWIDKAGSSTCGAFSRTAATRRRPVSIASTTTCKCHTDGSQRKSRRT